MASLEVGMAIKHIVVSVATTAASLTTAKYAIYLAKILQAKLTAIYVIDAKILQDLLRNRVIVESEALSYERDLQQQGEAFLERVKKLAEVKDMNLQTLLLKGSVHDEVLNKTRELAADILVMGELKEVLSRRETFYDEGEAILFGAPCPVVMVKNPQAAEDLYREA
jgi:nucleotide-binding universal stress UspA family protein